MAALRLLSSRGDAAVEWDPAKVETGDPEALAAVREAERVFREHRQRGGTAFRLDLGEPATRIDEFDPQAEHVILVPRVAGG